MKSIGKALLWIVGISVLLLIPLTGGKMFDAVTDKLFNKEAPPIELKDIKSEPGLPPGAFSAEAKPESAAEGKVLAAKQQYLEGLKYFQLSNYERAKEEWLAAQELDPYNQEVQEGLKRIKAITAPQPE
jgi:hypothetical protein